MIMADLCETCEIIYGVKQKDIMILSTLNKFNKKLA